MLGTLSDASEKVTMAAHRVFMPSCAMWALELGRIESDIVSHFVQKLDNLVQASHILCYISFSAGILVLRPSGNSMLCVLQSK